MAKLIEASDISTAWVKAMDYLLDQGGKTPNLIMCVAPSGVGDEIPAVRRTFNVFLEEHESKRVRPIKKVADTIFPRDFYHGGPGKEARDHLYQMQRNASKIERRFIKCGTYFDRLMDWPSTKDAKTEVDRNQLERLVQRMRSHRTKGRRNGNAYELAVSIPQTTPEINSDNIESGDLRVQDPILDQRIMGFPCLSHISLTLFDGRLDMTAQYRNQHFITKAYGNLVGLSDLQRFIAAEVGCDVGELVCVATHADAEIGLDSIGIQEIRSLVATCCSLLDVKK